MDGILICIFVFAVLLGLFGSGVFEEGAFSADCDSDKAPIVYKIDLSASRHRGPNEEYRGPDYSQLYGLLPGSTIAEIAANLEEMIESHGGSDFFILETVCDLANADYLETHGPLLLGDKIKLDIDGMSKYESFKFVRGLLEKDGTEIGLLSIYKDNPAFGLIDMVKITSAYVADYEWWRNGEFPPASHKLMVFYERNEGGDDEDEGDLPPGYVESVMFCLDQILKHNKNLLKKDKPENNAG